MILPIHLVAASPFPLTLLLTTNGQQVDDPNFVMPLVIATLLGALAKGVAFPVLSGNISQRGFGVGLGGALLASLSTAAVLLSNVNATWVPMSLGALILFTVWASLTFAKKIEDSPWSLLTPARLGILSVIMAVMAAIWTRIGSGIEPSFSIEHFDRIRTVVVLLAAMTACVSAALWEGAVATRFIEKEHHAKALRAIIIINVASVVGCTIWGAVVFFR